MRTFRLSLVGTVILMLLVGSGGRVLAVETEERPASVADGQTIADTVNEAIASGDPDAIEAIFAPDALFILDDEVVADGRDALVAMIPNIPNTFRQIGPVAEYVASDGDLYVAALMEIAGPGHPMGDPLVGFWRVRDGMVIRHAFMDAEHY